MFQAASSARCQILALQAKLYDQFGFKPTGSTTAALVDIINTIAIMLETNKYLRRLLIDFSKAFDSGPLNCHK